MTDAYAKNTRRYFALQPWQLELNADQIVITAHVEASGKREAIVIINQTSGAMREELAAYICRIVNDFHNNQNLLQDAMDALEQVVEEAGLTFSSEQAVDQVITRFRAKGS
jgi:hypothetical protein